MVQDLQKQFLHDWFDDTKQNLLDASLYFPKQNPGTFVLENKEKHLINFVSYHQTSHAKIAFVNLEPLLL
jgi:hypothetical protein